MHHMAGHKAPPAPVAKSQATPAEKKAPPVTDRTNLLYLGERDPCLTNILGSKMENT